MFCQASLQYAANFPVRTPTCYMCACVYAVHMWYNLHSLSPLQWRSSSSWQRDGCAHIHWKQWWIVVAFPSKLCYTLDPTESHHRLSNDRWSWVFLVPFEFGTQTRQFPASSPISLYSPLRKGGTLLMMASELGLEDSVQRARTIRTIGTIYQNSRIWIRVF